MLRSAGASGAGVAAIITSPTSRSASFMAQLEFPATNNTAEYESILLALRKAWEMGAPRLLIHTDSQVAAGHIDKSYQARSPELTKYLEAFRKAETHFRGITASGVPRATITDVDALVKAAAGGAMLPSHVLYKVLCSPAAFDMAVPATGVAVIDAEPHWRLQITDILAGRAEPSSAVEHQRLRQRGRGYVLVEGALYKTGVCVHILRCVSRSQGAELLKEVHDGHCGTHLAPRALAAKAL